MIIPKPGHAFRPPTVEEYIAGNGRAVSLTTIRKFIVLNLHAIPSLNPKPSTPPKVDPPAKTEPPKVDPPKEDPIKPATPAEVPSPEKSKGLLEWGFGAAVNAGLLASLGPAGAAAGFVIPILWRRRKRKKAEKIAPAAPAVEQEPVEYKTPHVEEVPEKDEPFCDREQMPERDMREAHSILRHGRLEGQDPILNSLFGSFVQNEIDSVLNDPDLPEESKAVIKAVKQRTIDRVNSATPLMIKGED
jgi:hypothetical protein